MGVLYQSLSGFPSDSPEGCPLIGWHNLVTASNITATTDDADFPISNVANPATHLKWMGEYNTGDEYITISGLGGVTLSYIAVAKHNWGTIGVPVSVEVQNDSPAVFTEIVPAQTLTDDSPIIFRIVPQSVQNIRIKLAVTDTSAVPEAAVIYAGELLVLERSITIGKGHTPITYGRRTNVVSGMSTSANFLGRVVLGEYRTSKAEFEWFTPEFYRSDIDDFLAAAQELPFFWAWSPIEYPLETGYCWLTNDAEPEVDPVTRRIALTLEMRGVA